MLKLKKIILILISIPALLISAIYISDIYQRNVHDSNIKKWQVKSVMKNLNGYIVYRGRDFQEYKIYSLKELKDIRTIVYMKPVEKRCVLKYDLEAEDPGKVFLTSDKNLSDRSCLTSKFASSHKKTVQESFDGKISNGTFIPGSTIVLATVPFSLGFYNSHYLIAFDIKNPDERFLISKSLGNGSLMYLSSLNSSAD